ncbi:MAG: cell surface glycoprotein 2, partial [Sedimentibacter sp.]|nr:cell surface glycoprotein 2 [Sedimentibacter sp.]
SSAAKGWVKGYPDGSFKPDQYITRAEFVTLVNNILGRNVHKENILGNIKVFPDLTEDMWYYEAMVEAINSHINSWDENLNEVWIEIIYPTLDL